MRITYTGRQVELAPAQLRKLQAQCAKLGKMLDGKHECEVRVILSHERHLHKAEVTMGYHDHSLVGIAEDSDLFAAVHGAIGKLEKQALKVRTKWRDGKRVPRNEVAVAATPGPAAPPAARSKPSSGHRDNHRPKIAAVTNNALVRRVDDHAQRKPMTLEEAMIEMEGNRDYLAFLDAKTGFLNVLVRRRDGRFDLVEP